MGEQEAGEVVHGKTQLVAVRAGAALRAASAGADPGVVDEDVQPVVVCGDGGGKSPHFGERGEVGRKKVARPPALRISAGGLLCPLCIAAMQQDVGSELAQLDGDPAPDTVGRAGDEDSLLAHGPLLLI